jgi:mono/diheme cytochrome c family protein
MGHCNQCHTPRNLAQALEPQHALGGATIEGWYAPDISNDPGSQINHWSTDQLARFLKVGTTPDNAKVVGPMQEAVHTSLSKMTTADLRDIAVYLKDQPPIEKPEIPTKAYWAANRQADGKLVYENNCSGCHQGNGQGIQGTVPALANDGAVTAAEPYNVIMALLEGFAPHGSWGAMASFANTLNDDQIADVTNYVRTAWGNTAPANATPWGVSSWRKTADVAKNESHALLCPNLTSDVVQPALNAGPNALKMAASDGTEMSKLIGDYRTARPKTSTAELIEALSTAYCRVLAADRVSSATMSVELADFTQRVATAVNPRKTSS